VGREKAFDVVIPPSKDDALTFANITNAIAPVRVYSDGSGFEGGIGASALLYVKECLVKVLRVHLGSASEHTVYEAEGVGLVMGLHLLNGLNRQLTQTTVMGTDSQAVIRALGNQKLHAGQYILDAIHNAAEQLQAKQDRLINREDRAWEIENRRDWTGRKRGVISLQAHWVPGHRDFEPNERADEEAKKATMGDSSKARHLPTLLRKCLPLSVSALRQENTAKLAKRWARRWNSLARESRLKSIDNTAPSKKYLRLIKDLDCRQASLLFQLRSGHIALNHHLFRTHRSETPSCPHCQGITVETVKHFLLDCPQYAQQRHELLVKLRRNADSLSFLLSSPVAVRPLLKYVHATGRFKPFFGKDIEDRNFTNSRRNTELRTAAEHLEDLLRGNNPRNANQT
jgi:ribonuclease HI